MARSSRKLSRKTAMQGRPMRIPPVKTEMRDNGGALITVMLDSPRWVRFIGGKSKAQRSYGLDRFGRQVYEACDGKTGVRRIVKRFAADNGLGLAEAAHSVPAAHRCQFLGPHPEKLGVHGLILAFLTSYKHVGHPRQ